MEAEEVVTGSFNSSYPTETGEGGYGGGATGGEGVPAWPWSRAGGEGGTQFGGYAFGVGQSGTGSPSGAGGGGWYGGKWAGHTKAGGGGSGYVLTSTSYKPSGYDVNSKYYLTNASMKGGNESFPAPSGGNETGHSGNGYARITLIE